ncbi:hypothetical protein HYY69_04185 [Candidatus Woesearchaeota archaeon]|nr:hypothetical protein [Candidatus Woesearchaeota archaeon]
MVDNKKNVDLKNNNDSENDSINKLNQLGHEITKLTKKPLLILYYCDAEGRIFHPDAPLLFDILSSKVEKPIEELDVLIHTKGGHPNTAYKMIQIIRKFAYKVNFLIPHHAYSGGTLMSLGANKIYMGPYASLGPIDLQLYGGALPLLSIQKYIEFIKDAKDKLSPCENPSCPNHKAIDVEKVLILELTKEFTPSQIGQLFNLKKLTEYYAKVLLNDYMFKYDENRKKTVERIVERLNTDYPSHDFDIDITIAEGLGLKVDFITPELFFVLDKFINLCHISKNNGEICFFLPRDKLEGSRNDFRTPYFALFMYI